MVQRRRDVPARDLRTDLRLFGFFVLAFSLDAGLQFTVYMIKALA